MWFLLLFSTSEATAEESVHLSEVEEGHSLLADPTY
jgi:hypothetical protein